jgi:AcrR family transcriptional regulator
MRARTERGAASQRRLLEAASCELVERRGVLEVESVARRAGVSVGLIYRYFGSKAGLVGAVVEDFYGRFERRVMKSNPAPGADWARRERERTVRAVAFHYAEPLAPVVLSHLHLEPAVAVIEARQLDQHIDLAARNVALGQRAGELPADLDPRFAAAMVLGGLRRVLADALAREPRPPQKFVAEKLWRFIAAIVGVRAGPGGARPPRKRGARRAT